MVLESGVEVPCCAGEEVLAKCWMREGLEPRKFSFSAYKISMYSYRLLLFDFILAVSVAGDVSSTIPMDDSLDMTSGLVSWR